VQGGGQPFDLGTITSGTKNFIISSVRSAEENAARHTGHFEGSDEHAAPFAAGDEVQLKIDVPRRGLNSRIHSAGHILGVAIMRLSREGKLPELVEMKAKHYPDDASVEFKGLIDGKAKDMIQEAADALVAEARPLFICFWSKAECQEKGVALPDKVEGDIFRTVDIEGCGAYACGGTHVKDTKGVGKIIVRSIKRQKGQTRVGYAVG
jgi:Ser-tRNA(Ala) deacylase AlaX